MGKIGRMYIQGMKQFQKELEKLQSPDEFLEQCAKELATRLLAKVVKRTPVGDYDTYKILENGKRKRIKKSSKKGGTLRRGWDIGEIKKEGNNYQIEVINHTNYASYVEYGHRTPNHMGWVNGRFMMTISEQELEGIAPKVLEMKIKNYLKACGLE